MFDPGFVPGYTEVYLYVQNPLNEEPSDGGRMEAEVKDFSALLRTEKSLLPLICMRAETRRWEPKMKEGGNSEKTACSHLQPLQHGRGIPEGRAAQAGSGVGELCFRAWLAVGGYLCGGKKRNHGEGARRIQPAVSGA